MYRNRNRADRDDLLAASDPLTRAVSLIAEAFAADRGYERQRYVDYVACEFLDAAVDGILNRAVESEQEWLSQEALEARYDRCR